MALIRDIVKRLLQEMQIDKLQYVMEDVLPRKNVEEKLTSMETHKYQNSINSHVLLFFGKAAIFANNSSTQCSWIVQILNIMF